jgi:dienelactone hydrolase
MLVELGYVALAVDVYGKQHLGSDDASALAQMNMLKANRPLLQERLALALAALSSQDEVNESKIAAIGFCFGGLCVLDMARMDMPVAGVASFHGLFEPPPNSEGRAISARVLVLHGWDDPLATPDKVLSLADELSSKGADWQIHGYGNTQHAFTNPKANDSSRGTVYNEVADHRSWQALQNFLSELFGS